MKKIFTIIALVALSLTAFAQQKKVAVYVTGDNADVNKVLGSKLTTAILNNVGYSAIERTAYFLDAVSKEQSYQHSGAVDDNELSRLGKQLGVQYVCVAAASEVFGEQYVSARLIDVESAQVELTANRSAYISSLPGWMEMATSLANALFTSQGKEKQADSKKVAVYVIKNDASKVIGRVLGDKLVEGFTNSGRYIAIERTNSFLAQLSKEQNYQREGAVDDEEIARLGKQFGVRFVCVADMSDLYGEKFIVVRMIDVEKAEVVNNFDISGTISNMSECVAIANKITEYLSKGTPQELAEERARIEAEREAKIQEQKRIEEERQRALAEERRKIQERVEKRKSELKTILDRGYAIVRDEKTGVKYMICLSPLDNITCSEYLNNFTYSRFGYSDWRAVNSWGGGRDEIQWIQICYDCKTLDVNWDQFEQGYFADFLEYLYYFCNSDIFSGKFYWGSRARREYIVRNELKKEYEARDDGWIDKKERSRISFMMAKPDNSKITSKSVASVILYREIK